MNIAVFASGNGSNFQVLAEKFPHAIKLLFSDHHEAYVLERAKKLQVPCVSFELKEFTSKAAYEMELVEILREQKIELVLLAGYMKIITPVLLQGFSGSIVNIHPSYLPNFAGSPHAIEESHAAKAGLGVTVHYVDEGVDTGEIIRQVELPYLADLAAYEAAVHAQEYRLYPEVVAQLLAGK